MPFRYTFSLYAISRSSAILTSGANPARTESARAFVHSLNILVKYVRLYGFDPRQQPPQLFCDFVDLGAVGGVVDVDEPGAVA